MILLAILLIPILTGLLLLPFRKAKLVRSIALASSILNLLLTLILAFSPETSAFHVNWINYMGINFSLGYDGISLIMLLLTNLLFPFILLAGFGREQRNVHLLNFLILFAQSALIGVFLPLWELVHTL